MKWLFAKVQEETFYFGEMRAQNAHGLGLFIYNIQMSFYGEWADGELKQVFVDSEETDIPNEDFRVINAEIIFSDFEVYNQVRDFNWDKETKELLYSKYESCKLILNNQSVSENKEYKVKLYDLSDLSMIFQILKQIHLFFIFNSYRQMLYLHFMSVNFSSRNLEFYLVTNYYEDPVQLLQRVTRQEKISIYHQLLEGLQIMHNKNISPDNISPFTIVATKNSRMENILAISDFTKARKFNSNSSGFWVNSFFTRERNFRAPENFSEEKYDPFKSDIFSIILTICAFEINDFTIGQNIVSFEQLIKKVSEIKGFITIESIRACLDFEPAKRPSINQLIIKKNTTQL